MRIFRDGVGLSYQEAGQGGPPIVLVHGWGTDWRVLQPLFDQLRRAHRVLAVDLRGFGDSDAPAQAYTIQGYSDDIAFLIARLGLQRPIVIGHSMGGMIALDFAARHPAHLAAAVMLEAMVVAPAALGEGLRAMLDSVRSDGYREFVAGLMNHLTGAHFDSDQRARMVAFIAACPQHVLVSALEGIVAFDSVAAAAAVNCPLLYVGTNTTYTDADRFRKLCPQLEIGQLVGCGHYFPLEVSEQLNPMIARFIATKASFEDGALSPHQER
jgi:pimeloyl-ACP methyl ester carboxylesterase